MQDPKLDVLVVIRHYLPGHLYGGPIRSIANLVDALGSTLRIGVVCSDRDWGVDQPYPGVTQHEWTTVLGSPVLYVYPEDLGAPLLRSLVERTGAKVLYTTGLWDIPIGFSMFLSHRLRPVAPKIVTAVRGELQPGALATGKSVLKKICLGILGLAGAEKGIVWQATADHETEDIYRAFPSLRQKPGSVAQAYNLPAQPKTLPPDFSTKQPGRASLVISSRVSVKKRTVEAVEILAEAPDGVTLDILGAPDYQDYMEKVLQARASLEKPDRVVAVGSLPHEKLMERLPGYDGLLLPTAAENYAHAIVEALACGLPAIISDQTPWNSLQEFGAGWVVPVHDRAALAKAVNEIAEMGPEEHGAMRRRARQYFDEVVLGEESTRAYREMFTV